MSGASSGWDDVCWICLQGQAESSQSTPLIYPCACPRPVHEACLAKWQLHCCGRDEEFCCRFCNQPLPHWRQTFKQQKSSSLVRPVAPLMSIQFHGQTYWLQVQMGEGGVNQFQSDVKRLLDLNSEDDFDITFECQVPGEGGKVELHGLQAFDAAVYCASLTAAERMTDASTNTSTDDLLQPSSSSTSPSQAHACQGDPAGAGSSGAACGCSSADEPGQPSSTSTSSSPSSKRERVGSSPGASSSSSTLLRRASSDATSYGTAVEDLVQPHREDVHAGLASSDGDWDLQIVSHGMQRLLSAAGRAWSWAAGKTMRC